MDIKKRLPRAIASLHRVGNWLFSYVLRLYTCLIVRKVTTRIRVLIVAKDSFLVVESMGGGGELSLPGGGMLAGESAKNAAIREVHEETGIVLGKDSVKKLNYYSSEALGDSAFDVACYYVCLDAKVKPRRCLEIVNAEWVTIHDEHIGYNSLVTKALKDYSNYKAI